MENKDYPFNCFRGHPEDNENFVDCLAGVPAYIQQDQIFLRQD